MGDSKDIIFDESQSVKDANIKCFLYYVLNKPSFINITELNKKGKNILSEKCSFDDRSNYEYYNQITDLNKRSILRTKQYITIKNLVESNNMTSFSLLYSSMYCFVHDKPLPLRNESFVPTNCISGFK